MQIQNSRFFPQPLFAQPAVCYARMTLSLLPEEFSPKCERAEKRLIFGSQSKFQVICYCERPYWYQHRTSRKGGINGQRVPCFTHHLGEIIVIALTHPTNFESWWCLHGNILWYCWQMIVSSTFLFSFQQSNILFCCNQEHNENSP